MSAINLQQFHDDTKEKKFHSQMKVSFGQCNKNKYLSLAELLRFTTDCAGEDYTLKGLGWDVLKENGLAILASRVSYNILKMPKDSDLIELRTWEEKSQGLLLTRRYEIFNMESKELMVDGLSFWTAISFEQRKIIPPKSFNLRPEPDFSTEYSGKKPGKINIELCPEFSVTRTVMFSDLDSNNHVNNSRYASYALDILPIEAQEKEWRNFRINYSKEAHLGDLIELTMCKSSDLSTYVVFGKINGQLCFECEFSD